MPNIDLFYLSGNFPAVFLLYAGPDQILPLVSVLGGLMGILLIWWQRVISVIRSIWHRFRKSSPEAELTSTGKRERSS